MVRKYISDPSKKKLVSHAREDIAKALDEMRKNKLSYRAAGKKHNISFRVLYRYNTCENVKKIGGQTVLSPEEENLIVENINTCVEWGYPMKRYDLQLLVKNFLEKKGVKCKKFKNNMPGIDFVVGFLKRHKNEIPEKYTQSIMRKGRTEKLPTIIKKYFDHLELTLNYMPTLNIINCIEINLSDDPMLSAICRESKYPDSITDNSVSLIIAGTAAGILLAPYVIYKAQSIPDSWKSGGPDDTFYNKTVTGWMDIITFEDWIENIIIPYTNRVEGTTYLIVDSNSCHLSSQCIKNCNDHEINLIFLPPKSMQLTQPLYVAFYKTIKNIWRDILCFWKKIEGINHKSNFKSVFPLLLNKLYNKINAKAETNLMSGFMKTGVSPLNRGEVLAGLPALMKTIEMQEKIARSKRKIQQDNIAKNECSLKLGTSSTTEPRKKIIKLEGSPQQSLDQKDSIPVKIEYDNEIEDMTHMDNLSNNQIKSETISSIKSDKEYCNIEQIDNGIVATSLYELDIKPIAGPSSGLMCWICHVTKTLDDSWIRCTYCKHYICNSCSGNYMSPHEFICLSCFLANNHNSIEDDKESLYILLV